MDTIVIFHFTLDKDQYRSKYISENFRMLFLGIIFLSNNLSTIPRTNSECLGCVSVTACQSEHANVFVKVSIRSRVMKRGSLFAARDMLISRVLRDTNVNETLQLLCIPHAILHFLLIFC